MEEYYNARRELLLKQIKSYDDYNRQCLQLKNQNMLTEEEIQHFQKPVIKELKPLVNELALVKQAIKKQTEKILSDETDETEETPAIEFSTAEDKEHELDDDLEPVFIDNFLVNDQLKNTTTITPKLGEILNRNKKFQIIIINGKRFALARNNNIDYICIFDTAKDKYRNRELTKELLNLITGFGSEDKKKRR